MTQVSKFPEKGDIVTVKCKRVIEKIIENKNTAIIHKTKDRSFDTSILECLYSDDRIVVVRLLDCSISNKPIILLREEYEWYPANPDLLIAMEIPLPKVTSVDSIIEENIIKFSNEEAKEIISKNEKTLLDLLLKLMGRK